jgi:hypothetical protein
MRFRSQTPSTERLPTPAGGSKGDDDGKRDLLHAVSLDGFVAGPNNEVDRLFRWYFSGDTEIAFRLGSGPETINVEGLP